MALPVANLLVNIGANPAGAIAGIEQVSGMMGAGGMLPMAALGAGAIMVGVGVAATKMASDFQSELTSLVTGAGESQKNLSMVHDGILQMSRDTGTSVKQLVDGMYMIESGGYHGAAGLAILKAAAEGAKVGTADLGVVADATDTILKNYPGVINGADGAVNTLISTVAHGKTHMEDLASSLAQVLPTASAAGIGLNDVMGAMATMTGEGVPAAEAATYLRQTMIALMAPASGARKALEAIGLTSKEVAETIQKQGLPAAMQMIEDNLQSHGFKIGSAEYIAKMREIAGGSKQMQGMLDLGGHHLKTFAENADTVAGAAKNGGKAITGWALVQQTANQQFDRARQGIVSVFIAFGEKLLPIVTTVAKFFADHLPGAIKTFQTSVGPVVKVIGDLITSLTKNKPLMDALKEGFERLKPAIGPILTILAVTTAVALVPLALLIGAVVALFLALTHIPEIAGAVGRAVGTMNAMIGEAIGNVLGAIGSFFGDLFGTVGRAIGNMNAMIGGFIGNLLGTIGHFRDEAVKKVGEFVLNALAKFHELQVTVSTKIKELVTSVIQHFIDMEKRGLERIGAFKDSVIQKAKDLATGFLNALMSLPGKMLALGEQLIRSLAQGINNARHSVVDALKNVPLIGGLAGGVSNLMDNMPHFASGGIAGLHGPEIALVGEREPEAIIPLSQLPAGLRHASGAIGGGTVTLIVQTNIDGRRVAETILPHMTPALRNALGNHRF